MCTVLTAQKSSIVYNTGQPMFHVIAFVYVDKVGHRVNMTFELLMHLRLHIYAILHAMLFYDILSLESILFCNHDHAIFRVLRL